MLDTLLTALTDLMSVQHLSFMMLGILVGLVIGVLPALGGIAGMSLLIPFIYGMDKVSALAMLIGLVATVPTGDTYTSVLIGVPGAAGSQATILDGFPLAKRGQAARALSAAFTGSALGGIFGAFVLTAFVLVAKPVILAFGAGELFMLGILGLSVVGVLAGKSVARGIASAGLGLIAGAVGAAPATGEFRLDLGIEYLNDGIPLVIIGLGMFALPELTDLMRRNRPIASTTSTLGSGWLQGVKDTFIHWFLVLRCSVIGTICGVIPGVGGGVVDWIAYGHAVQSARDKSEFGKGDIRGVLASETSNNSLQGGALLPTILFGIPGSGSTAIFLGGMVLLGIQPGPSMVTTDLHLTYTIAWTLTLASVIGAALCFLLAYPISRLTYVPFNLLAPAVISIVCFAAFQVRQSLTDLVLLFVLGLFGLFMRRFGWPRAAFLVGFVLSPQIENYLYQAVQFYDWNFVTRPGVLIIGALSVVSLWAATRGRISETGEMTGATHKKDGSAAAAALNERTPQIAFALLVLAIFAYALITCSQLNFLGAVFPTTTAAVMLVFSAYLLVTLTFGGARHPSSFDQELEGEHVGDPGVGSVWAPVLWFALLFGLAGLFGFIIAMALFIPAFLLTRTSIGLLPSLMYGALAVGLMVFAGYMLVLDFPSGLLQSLVELPWPLR